MKPSCTGSGYLKLSLVTVAVRQVINRMDALRQCVEQAAKKSQPEPSRKNGRKKVALAL